MRLPRLKILGPLIGVVLAALLSWTKDVLGIPPAALYLGWGFLLGIVATVVAYALVEGPPMRTRKTYVVPVGTLLLRFHMRIARDMDDPIPQPAGVLCGKDRLPMILTPDPDAPVFWECPSCGLQVLIRRDISESGRALALAKWRERAPSDE